MNWRNAHCHLHYNPLVDARIFMYNEENNPADYISPQGLSEITATEERPVHPLIENNRDALRALCVRYRVRRLALFGSVTGDQFDPETSDIDILVEFESMTPVEHANCYFGLMEALEERLQLSVDLVEPGPITNSYFRQAIEQTQVVLYEAA